MNTKLLMKTNLIPDLPEEKNERDKFKGFFCLEVYIMMQPCQDDEVIVFTYLLIIPKYRIDLSDGIFIRLKLSCKKDLALPHNVFPLIVIQSQVMNKVQSCFSLRANDFTSSW